MKIKKLSFLFLLTPIVMLLLHSCDGSPSEDAVQPMYSFLVGTYNEEGEQGIGLLSFDPDNGLLTNQMIGPAIKNPSFVITNKAQTYVFAVEETAGVNGGKVKSFKMDQGSGTLEMISTLDTHGDDPCFLALDPNEDFLVVGNYSGGNFSVYKISEGSLIHVQTFQHEGQSINPSRQEKAHVHSTVFHPNNKQLLVGDLGTDKIHIYNFNPDYAVPFAPANPAYFEVSAGAGPRHLAIHPSGSTIYLIHELTAEVGVYSYDAGKVQQKQILPLTGNDFVGNVGAAEIRISPDGKFLYASNRGDANEISVFEIEKDGNLSFIDRYATLGETPRNFNFTSDGNYLLVANQASNAINVFERNQKTGKLSSLELTVNVHKPVYLFSLR